MTRISNSEEKEVRLTGSVDKRGRKLYGIYGKVSNLCYLLTPDADLAYKNCV